MKKLAVLLPILVLIAAAVFFAAHRTTRVRHANAELRASTSTSFNFDQRLELAHVACAGGKVSVSAKKEIFCSVCPRGSDFAATSSSPAGSPGWTLDGAIAGGFSAPHADEALVHAAGCESHAKNYGGDFLMRRNGVEWSTVRYASGGAGSDKCQKLPWPGGREALVCEETDINGGIVFDGVQLMMVDATAPSQNDVANSFFLALADQSLNCGFETSLTAKPHMIQLAKINSVEVMPEAADGNRNVAIDATIARVTSPATSGATCPAGHPQTYHLVFDNQGDYLDAGEGYVTVDALKREDCCRVTVSPRVRPARY